MNMYGAGSAGGDWQTESKTMGRSMGMGHGTLSDPRFGVSSIKGHRPYMEDEYHVDYCLTNEKATTNAMRAGGVPETNMWGVYDGT
jgi:hypothetical protein